MLDIEINTVCNLRCKTCFVDGYHRFDAPVTVPRERVRAIMAAGREQFGGTLHLMGGEPLLHPELLEIISDGFDMGFSSVMINTNGTRVDAAMAARLAAFPAVDVLVSLDGPEPLNDEIRGPGVYRRALEAIRLLHEAGVQTSAMVTVTRRLLPLLPGWVGELRNLGALKVIHLMPVGQLAAESRPGAGAYTELLTAQELLQLYLVSWVNRPLTRITEDPLVNLFYHKMGLQPRRSDQCEACSSRIAVQADGRVSPCHPSDFAFGRFDELDLAELPQAETYRRMAANDFDLCRDCRYHDICGMCGARVYAATGNPLGGTPICVELKQLLGLQG
ncbi:MAG TPA: radical SAM protein [Symbiobacteriaceae bacterium]|nr:radical SAM protein [Symbiobacteriaceae bacterium]